MLEVFFTRSSRTKVNRHLPPYLLLRENPHNLPNTYVYPTQIRWIHATQPTQLKNAAHHTTRAGKLRLKGLLRVKQMIHEVIE